MNVRTASRSDFSMGIQNASSWKLRQPNEIEDGRNLRFNEVIGSIVRRDGYVASGSQFSASGKAPCGFHTAFFTTGARSFVAVPAEDNSSTLIKVQENDGAWTTLSSVIPIGADVHFVDYRDEVFVSGYTTADNIPFQPLNINKELNVSTSRNLLFAPWPKYFIIYRGLLYAANVKVADKLYPDRFYKSSAPTGAMTFVRGEQTDVYAPVNLINQIPPMTSNTAPMGEASASAPAGGAEDVWRAFDQQLGTQALFGTFTAGTGIGSGILVYDFGASNAKTITYYSVRGFRNDVPARSPKDWTFEGSNNNTTWTVLDTRTNATWTVDENRTYTIPNTTAYRYYRMNITKNASGANGEQVNVKELAMFTSLQGTKLLQLNIDSARYPKPGMNIEIWKAGKNIKLYDIVIADVDKANNSITYLPENYTPTAINTTTDTISVPTNTSLQTGSTIKFSTTGTLPSPLVVGTTYYVIRIDATNIKVASSYDNAVIGLPIDISSSGTAVATQTVTVSYHFDNNDEIFLKDRHELLTTFWNTDYPTPDKADWSAVQSGADSSIAIVGGMESANRLFLFTENSTTRFDGSNPMLISKTIGCASMRSIKNLDDDWMIWMTPRGRVYARNEAGGQQEYISRGMYNKFFSKLNITQLRASAAGITDGEYSVYVGEVDGEYSRAVYDFGSNTWSVDVLGHPTLLYANKVINSIMKPMFVSNDGRMYQDDTGHKDGDKVTRFQVDFGKVNYGVTNIKQLIGAFIYSEYAIGLKIVVSVDNKDPVVIGEITSDSGEIIYKVNGNNKSLQGSTFALSLKGAVEGPPQVITSIDDYFNVVQEVIANGKKQ